MINNHKLKLVTNANNISDCCVDSAMTAYFISPIPVSTTKVRELNKLKWSICDLVSLGGLKKGGWNKWRAHKVGTKLPKYMRVNTYGMHLMHCYLHRHMLVISGVFSTD